MGLRGIRLSLGGPRAFVTQIEAILRASRSEKLKFCFRWYPLWRSPRSQSADRSGSGRPASGPRGCPLRCRLGHDRSSAAVLTLDPHRRRGRFSVRRSNDLTQYLLAWTGAILWLSPVSAMHPSVPGSASTASRRYPGRKEAVRICGEISNNRSAPSPAGMGYTQFSMYAPSIRGSGKFSSRYRWLRRA